MSVNIRYPNITGRSEKEQLTQIKSYLHQLVDNLNYALPNLGTGGSTASTSTTQVQGGELSYYELRSLIIQEIQKLDTMFEQLSQNVETDVNEAVETSLREAKESGEFDGKDGQPGQPGADGQDGQDGVSCTHSWDGTVLTINSASGTSSADLKGEKGDRGEQGEKGEKGDNGEQGPTGPQGPQGPTGPQGVQGLQGIQGPVGDTGPQGPQGIQGPQGEKGDKGDTGAQGVQGIQGIPGQSGLNLIVRSQSTPGFWYDTTGKLVQASNDNAAMETYISIIPGKQYTFSRKAGAGDYFRFSWYDSEKVYMSRKAITEITANKAGTYTWTAPSGAYFMRVSYPWPEEVEAKLEEGATATHWCPAVADLAPKKGEDYFTEDEISSVSTQAAQKISFTLDADGNLYYEVEE